MNLKQLAYWNNLFNTVVFSIIFCVLLWTIGYNWTAQELCKSYNSSVYLYLKHDFKNVKDLQTTNYHCLKEIPKPTCFAGQKQILFGVKCYIQERVGVDYGYKKTSNKN